MTLFTKTITRGKSIQNIMISLRYISNMNELKTHDDAVKYLMNWNIMKHCKSDFVLELRESLIKYGKLSDDQLISLSKNKYVEAVLKSKDKFESNCIIDPIQLKLLSLNNVDWNNISKILGDKKQFLLFDFKNQLINSGFLTYKQMAIAGNIMHQYKTKQKMSKK